MRKWVLKVWMKMKAEMGMNTKRNGLRDSFFKSWFLVGFGFGFGFRLSVSY